MGIVANLAIGLEGGHLEIPLTLVRGQKLGLLLRRIFLDRGQLASFDELPIPFRAVATELDGVTTVRGSALVPPASRASAMSPNAISGKPPATIEWE